MAARGQRFFDAVVVVGDFERAEVEFADVRGFERIFASALAALERLHVTVLFTHKLFCTARPRASPNFRFQRTGDDAYRLISGNKKAPTHEEKGRQNGCASSHFSQADDA